MQNKVISYTKLHKVPMVLVLLSLVFYFVFAYHLPRTDFIKLLTLFGGLFFLCFKLIQFEKWNYKFLLIAGILFRFIFILAEPNLSQDYYRFIWDGELVSNFINPYVSLPDTLIEQKDLVIANAKELYNGMGALSARHYSNYPPMNQLLFALSAFLGGKSILGTTIVMRIIIILADLGIFYFGRKLLRNLNQSPHLIFWYFLNPLVLVELTLNLHFEGVMLFFFLWAMYLLSVKKWITAAIPYALAILVKLVPLIFLPLFLKYLGIKKSIIFYLVIGCVSVLLLLPFYSSEFINNYSETVGLWFSNFEFNAGLYNLIEKIAIYYDQKPWEFIKSYGKIVPYLTISIVFIFAILKVDKQLKNLLVAMLWVLSIYYFMSTTIHPWYIIFLLPLCIFTDFRFPIIWSAMVVLSYFAYSQTDFKENLWLLAIEYISVISFMCYEIIKLNKQKPFFRKNRATNVVNSI
ncbi:mannosyltransferase [Aurantibacter crassamenti]|uniref:mannosyltransferase n=1 Tax=Aurantibacter crassamenti TaxID=1837375 RepID=UPI0019397520|nr:mannosyltransferase [Aurantibacter crassamenti]MBM1104722.1 mannosyltransferase [Aurantibacter crassamenti]